VKRLKPPLTICILTQCYSVTKAYILSAVKAGSVFWGQICTSVVNLAPVSTRAYVFI